MMKVINSIVRKITGYLKAVAADELKVMDAFYAQFD